MENRLSVPHLNTQLPACLETTLAIDLTDTVFERLCRKTSTHIRCRGSARPIQSAELYPSLLVPEFDGVCLFALCFICKTVVEPTPATYSMKDMSLMPNLAELKFQLLDDHKITDHEVKIIKDHIERDGTLDLAGNG